MLITRFSNNKEVIPPLGISFTASYHDNSLNCGEREQMKPSLQYMESYPNSEQGTVSPRQEPDIMTVASQSGMNMDV